MSSFVSSALDIWFAGASNCRNPATPCVYILKGVVRTLQYKLTNSDDICLFLYICNVERFLTARWRILPCRHIVLENVLSCHLIVYRMYSMYPNMFIPLLKLWLTDKFISLIIKTNQSSEVKKMFFEPLWVIGQHFNVIQFCPATDWSV